MSPAASTGAGPYRGMSAGFGSANNPAPPIAQQAVDPNQIIANMDPKGAALLAQSVPGAPALMQPQGSPQAPASQKTPFDFPAFPATSSVGIPETCFVTKGKLAQYSPIWYGTEEERQAVRDTLIAWGNQIKADTLIFFAATEWYYQPPQILKKGGMSDEEGAIDGSDH